MQGTNTANQHDHPEQGPTVHITIKGTVYEVHRGRQTVAFLKQLAGISAGDQLDQIVENKVIHLSDEGAVTLKGGEVFVSQPRSGGAS